MSKTKIRKPKHKVVRCEGCNGLVHPRRVRLVDPAVINVNRAPLYLCGKCRTHLVWNKLEKKSAKD